jgi:trehalose 6-phosphate synthase
MREIVRLRNVYRWAGQMLLDAADLRKRKRIIQIMSRGPAEVPRLSYSA